MGRSGRVGPWARPWGAAASGRFPAGTRPRPRQHSVATLSAGIFRPVLGWPLRGPQRAVSGRDQRGAVTAKRGSRARSVVVGVDARQIRVLGISGRPRARREARASLVPPRRARSQPARPRQRPYPSPSPCRTPARSRIRTTSASGTAPTRRTRGKSPEQSTTVDAGPPWATPPSRIRSTASPSCARISAASRASGSPERLAEVVGSGPTPRARVRGAW